MLEILLYLFGCLWFRVECLGAPVGVVWRLEFIFYVHYRLHVEDIYEQSDGLPPSESDNIGNIFQDMFANQCLQKPSS